MKTKSISLLSLFVTTLAFAEGRDVGNGGNAVVCYTDATKTTISSIELFDFWEQTKLHPELGAIDLGAPSLSVAEKVDLYFKRIEQVMVVNPKQSFNHPGTLPEIVQITSLKNYAKILEKNIESYLNDQIPTVTDDQSTQVPSGLCFKEQLAIQIRNPLPGEMRFKVSRSLYNHPKATNDLRAGIILHEAIYRQAIVEYQDQTSDRARFANYLLATDAYTKLISADPSLLQKMFEQVQLGMNSLAVFKVPNNPTPLILKRIATLKRTIPTDIYDYNDLNMFYSKYESHYEAATELQLSYPMLNLKIDPKNKKIFTMTESSTGLKRRSLEIRSGIFRNRYEYDHTTSLHFSDTDPDLIEAMSTSNYVKRPNQFTGSFGAVECNSNVSYFLETGAFRGCIVSTGKNNTILKTARNSITLYESDLVNFSLFPTGELKNIEWWGRGSGATAFLYTRFQKELLNILNGGTTSFDQAGYVIRADLAPSARESMKFNYQGQIATPKGLYWDSQKQKQFATEVSIPILPMHDGKQILYKEMPYAEFHICRLVFPAVKSYWRFISYNQGRPMEQGSPLATDAIGPQNFYDLDTMLLVQKTDEPVTVFDPNKPVTCLLYQVPIL